MPVSEDEFERPNQMAANQAAMSKAEQRKSNKPIMEKRRRARINHCLNELKTLILDAMKKDPARHSKLEKADILEMTVKHLQQIQRQQLTTAVAADPTVIMRFKSGFDECAAEVSRYIGRLEGVDSGVKQRLTAHLHRCVSSLQQISPFPQQTMFSALTQTCDKSPIGLTHVPSVPGDVNNNSNQNAERIHIPGGLHLIPSRLPTGELALLVPNSNHISTFLNAPTGATLQFPANVNAVLSPTLAGNLSSPNHANHPSAFTAVGKNQEYPSPTSTADIVKKEPEREDNKAPSYPKGLLEPSPYRQAYNFKVTESRDVEDSTVEDYEKSNLLPSADATAIYGNFERDRKITQKPASSSFQKNAADSTTTTFLPVKEEDAIGTGFKPFQVELPNSNLKAHVTISRNDNDFEPTDPHRIHSKPNPKFTINPNKVYQKSPHKFVRAYPSGDNDFRPEASKFENVNDPIESTSGSATDDSNVEPTRSPPPSKPSSSSQTDESNANKSNEYSYLRKMVKRPLSQPETSTHRSFCESSAKIPRLSSPRCEDGESVENRCKRISVIVEDSSKTNGKENKRNPTTNVSSQKDMWRPW